MQELKKYYISKSFSFEAAHKIPNHVGHCKNVHGHSYTGEVILSSLFLNEMGMVMDYADLKKIIKEVILDKYDHSNLNLFFANPTAENMVYSMFVQLESRISDKICGANNERSLVIERVILNEQVGSSAWVVRG